MKRLSAAYPELNEFASSKNLNLDESIAITALFHDLCKVNFYKTEQRNRKNSAGEWESYDAYTVSERLRYGGHGSKSVFIVQYYIKLRAEEAVAINCHMGIGDGKDHISEAYEENILAWLLHVADEAACYVKPIENYTDIVQKSNS